MDLDGQGSRAAFKNHQSRLTAAAGIWIQAPEESRPLRRQYLEAFKAQLQRCRRRAVGESSERERKEEFFGVFFWVFGCFLVVFGTFLVVFGQFLVGF